LPQKRPLVCRRHFSTPLWFNSVRAWGIDYTVLVSKGCWTAVNPGFGAEPTAAQLLLDQTARTILYMMVNKNSLDDIGNLPTAREAREVLKSIHTEDDAYHGLLVVKEYVNAAKSEEESINDYISRRRDLHGKASDAGFEFTEKNQCGFALLGLPDEYESVCRGFRAKAGEVGDFTHAQVKSRLTEEERKISRRRSNSGALRAFLPYESRRYPNQPIREQFT
jgi:hypothetical protein